VLCLGTQAKEREGGIGEREISFFENLELLKKPQKVQTEVFNLFFKKVEDAEST